MNKLFVFPLAFMFVLTTFSMAYIGMTYGGTTEDYSDSGDMYFNETESEGSGRVELPSAGSQSFNLWGLEGALIVLTIAIGIGIVSGIKILGSGLSEFSQKLIFNGVLFLGLWACLSIVANDFLFWNSITTWIWSALTLMYVIGWAQQVS